MIARIFSFIKKKWTEQRQAQLSAITDQLEKGVSEVFTSEKYAEYLKTMSKFTRYSTNNTILIAMQRPDVTLVAGYEAWKTKFGRQVMKGEKGIKIFAPVPYKTTVDRERLDPKTGKLMVDATGNPMTEDIEVTRAAFRVTTVFDVSQTVGKPLPELAPTLLNGDVADYEQFLQALIQTAQVPVTFEDISSGANGYYDRASKNIVVQKDLPEMQTIKTLIHETAHSRLHAIDENDPDSMKSLPDQNTREVQAESVAFVVACHYGLDTGDYSFTYIAGWSEGKEMPELKSSLQTIRETANDLIAEIDQNLYELEQEQDTALEIDDEPIMDLGQETNFRIEPTANNAFVVRADSEQFDKDAIIAKSQDRYACADYNMSYASKVPVRMAGVSANDRRPSIRQRLHKSQQAKKSVPARQQEQTKKRGKQNEL